MTESTFDGTAERQPAPAPSSFWEDALEIFIHPVAVYRRRADKSVWPPMLFVAIAIGVISFATFNTTTGPMMEAEFARNSAKMIAKNPQLTQETMDKMRDMSVNIAKYTLPVVMIVTLFIIGIFTWLASKLVGAKTTFNQGLTIAAWAYFPRVLQAVVSGVQGLILDSSKINSAFSLSLSPARFMDPDTANPLVYQIAGRFDLFTLWVTALLAVGVYVTGKIGKGQAIAFGVIMFIIGALPAIRNAMSVM